MSLFIPPSLRRLLKSCPSNKTEEVLGHVSFAVGTSVDVGFFTAVPHSYNKATPENCSLNGAAA